MSDTVLEHLNEALSGRYSVERELGLVDEGDTLTLLSSDGQRFLMIRTLEGGALDLVYVENWFEELEERLGG